MAPKILPDYGISICDVYIKDSLKTATETNRGPLVQHLGLKWPLKVSAYFNPYYHDKPNVYSFHSKFHSYRPENKLYLSLVMFSSFCVIYSVSLLYSLSMFMRVTLLFHLVGVYWYRYSTGAVVLPFGLPSSHK